MGDDHDKLDGIAEAVRQQLLDMLDQRLQPFFEEIMAEQPDLDLEALSAEVEKRVDTKALFEHLQRVSGEIDRRKASVVRRMAAVPNWRAFLLESMKRSIRQGAVFSLPSVLPFADMRRDPFALLTYIFKRLARRNEVVCRQLRHRNPAYLSAHEWTPFEAAATKRA